MQILTPGMDPNLIETGVPGLTVTDVKMLGDDLSVWFNAVPPVSTHGAKSENWPWTYSPDGRPKIVPELPTLTLKPSIDWSKPIQARDVAHRFQSVWVASTEFLRDPGEQPCVAIGSSGGSWAFRTHDNQPLAGDQWAHVVFENVPKTEHLWINAPGPGRSLTTSTDQFDKANVLLIFQDGELIDARLTGKKPNV